MAEKRRALLALALVVPAPSIGAAMAFWIAPGPVGSVAYGLGKLVLYGLPVAWLLFVDKERLKFSHTNWKVHAAMPNGQHVNISLESSAY